MDQCGKVWPMTTMGARRIHVAEAKEPMTFLQQCLVDMVHGAMARKGYRQVDLARKANITQKHLSQIMTGRAGGSWEMWDRILEVLK